MTTEIEGSPAPDGAPNAGNVPDSPPDGGDKTNAQERRDAERVVNLAKDNKDLKARLAEFEGKQKASAEALSRSEGKLEDIITARDADLVTERESSAAKSAQITVLENGNLERSIIDQLGGIEGLTASPKQLRRAYLGLVNDLGLDRYPKDAKKALGDREKLLRDECKELFGSSQPAGGSPPNSREVTTPRGAEGDPKGW